MHENMIIILAITVNYYNEFRKCTADERDDEWTVEGTTLAITLSSTFILSCFEPLTSVYLDIKWTSSWYISLEK